MHQQKIMVIDPAEGTDKPYPSHAQQWREYHGPAAWLFNPWGKQRRDARDVGSDPFGHLISAPQDAMAASVMQITPPAPKPDFIHLDANSHIVDADSEAVAVIVDNRHQLEWGALPLLKGKEVPHAEAMKVASEGRLLGGSNWQLASVAELDTVKDLTRYEPARHPVFHRWPKSGRAWTRDPVASPVYSGFAWYVFLSHGNSHLDTRIHDGCVLVCRPASPRQ